MSIEDDGNHEGYELIETENKKVFILAEHWHNIRSVPKATLKLLKYLHEEANVRILAIEQGTSTALLINDYLESGDSLILKDITRNTMFWAKENRKFFEDLRSFNLTLPPSDRIFIRSVDVEYKMESAIFILNQWMGRKEIPTVLMNTLGQFRQLFIQTKSHREQFDGLAVMFYYDKEIVTDLVGYTLGDLKANPEKFRTFFGDRYDDFSTLIQDMFDGLIFDYTNPNTNYKFRDRIIYQKFIDLLNEHPNKGILCVFGSRHATKGSSLYKLNTLDVSPVQNQVSIIRVSALYNRSVISNDLRRIKFNFPNLLRKQPATLIKHDPNDPTFKSKKRFHYTLFINELGNLTPFEKVYSEDY